MRRFRYSLRGVMLAIVLFCIALAAMRFPTPFWANVCYSVTLAALTLAVPAAVYRHGEQRAFWVGFAACGWVYFAVALAPWLEGRAGVQLVTTTVLDIIASRLVLPDELVSNYVNGYTLQFAPAEPTAWQSWNLPTFPPKKSWNAAGYVSLHCSWLYLRIGHAVFCMVSAILGGEFVRYLAATAPRPTATESVNHETRRR